jgi:ABC-2 type transport system ATP-binding protein
MNPATGEIAVQVKHLTKYYNDIKAVDGISLEIRQGEVFGLLGPNGAGKTTSINMICGLLKPDNGEVIINGYRISGKGAEVIRSKVGVCPQNIIIWPKLTCFEQLVFIARMYDIPRSIAHERADILLKRLELQEKRNKLACTLSGGMQRRLNILLALVHDPDFVIFDEPEAGLDPQSRVMVRDFIISTAREKTVIFTTHNMDEADRVSDRVAIIDRGKLLKLESVENLKKSIGEGDVIELTVKSTDENRIMNAAGSLEKGGFKVLTSGNRMIIKSRNIVEKIPSFYKILESFNLQIVEMNMRENTLEDVFIYLTGRSLRE